MEPSKQQWPYEAPVRVVVHKFHMGDVDDPDLYASKPLYDWEQSEMGQWVMKNSTETPIWRRMADPNNFGHQYLIEAKFDPKNYVIWKLKYSI